MSVDDPAPAQWARQALQLAQERLPGASADAHLEEARLILGENPALTSADRVAAIAQLVPVA